jgi:putative heme iron utilization protein
MSSNRHASSGPAPTDAPPEPPFSERARTLLHLGRTGTLATQSRKQPGFPFGSVAPYGVGAAGRPTFLISTMAMHTQNLAEDPRASLLVTQPGWTEDPLAGSRVSLLGRVTPVPEAEVEPVRTDYLARHEQARYWVDFDDFAFYRLDVVDLYFVAGFGAMGWVEADEYRTAVPDPLAEAAPKIVSHMNQDHADALVLYARAFANTEADSATMTAVDRLGFRIRAQSADRLTGLRINFPHEAHTADEVRKLLIEMLATARAQLQPTT